MSSMKRFLYVLAVTLLISVSPSISYGATYTYTWSGGTSTDWANYLNWSRSLGAPANSIPSSTDAVEIGISSFTNQPSVTTNNAVCASLTFGTAKAVTFTVAKGGLLTVGGTILQKHSSAGAITSSITGGGTITCTGLTVGDTPLGFTLIVTVTYLTTLNCNIAQLNINGDLTVVTTKATFLGLGLGTLYSNANFNLTNDNTVPSIVSVSGLLSVSNQSPGSTSFASITVTNKGADTATLKLASTAAISVPTPTYGSIDFYVPSGGAGRVGVEYANNTSNATQTVYSDGTAGLNSQGLSGATDTYQQLSFSGLGTKQIASGTLSLSGDWSSTVGKVDGLTKGSTVTFNGTAEKLYDAGSTNGGVTFKNVNFQGGNTKTISGTSATANGFSVAGTGVLTMSASTTLAVDASGKFTLNSNTNGTASVAPIPSGCSITGTVNVQRYIQAGTSTNNARNYRLLSSPVNINSTSGYTTLAYLTGSNTGVFTGGPGGLTNGFSVPNTTPTIYLYNESLPASNATFNSGNFKGLTNIISDPQKIYDNSGTNPNANATLYEGNGFMLYYVGNNVSNLNNKQNRVSGVYAIPDASTTTAIGTLNQGSIPVKLWWNGSTTLSSAKTGYNLVGNPYASTIDWNSVSAHNPVTNGISDKIYVYDYTSKTYGTYQVSLGVAGTHNASQYIGSGQGFFVVASGASPTLTFSESDKVTNQPAAGTLLMSLPTQIASAPQVLRVKLAKDSINTDEALIAFEPDARDTLEERDALRLNGIGNVATLATYPRQSTQMLVINHLHSIDSTTRIKLYVNMTDTKGIDSLSFSGLSTLDSRYDIFLLDHYKQDSLQINLYPHYSFNIRPDSAASFGADRFELVFHKKNAMNYRLLSFSGVPDNQDINVKWKVEAEQNATGFVLEKNGGHGTYNPVYSLQSDGSGAYAWLDKTPATGINQYRLKQNDIFGAITYSKVISVNFNPPGIANSIITVYPNPVQTNLQVSINAPDIPAQVLMKVISSNGQTLISKIASGNAIQQNVGNLLPGTYIVELSDNATKKIIGCVKISKS